MTMTKYKKRALAAVCALALAAGTAVASSVWTTRTLEAQYGDIKVTAAGQPLTLVDASGAPVEAFAVDGTVYLPIRAVGEALGKEIIWDNSTHTVHIGRSPFVEDASQLIETVESVHPAFAQDAVPEGYEAAKAALLAQAEDPDCTLADFTWSAMACLAALGDGHTRLDPFGGVAQPSLDVAWRAEGGGLFLTDEQGALTSTQVIAIGGVPVEAVFATVDRYVAAENQAGRDCNHTAWSASPALLRKAGAALDREGATVLDLLAGGVPATAEVGLRQPQAQSAQRVISTQWMGDVFYVDFNQCVDTPEFQDAAAELRQAVQDGGKVIVDIRGNGGGNSATCGQLLEAMGMSAPSYGAYVRYSPLAQSFYPQFYDQSSGLDYFPPNPSAAKQNPKVQLVVLTDEETFSSANMLAVFVRDGGLGALIGRSPANRPSHYGDILPFQLNHSGLFCTVSHKQWIRPNAADGSDTLAPDRLTAPGEDPLQAALASFS